MNLLFCALVLFQTSSTQTDWVSGPGTLGPVGDFGLAFYSSDSVSFNITGQISPVSNSVNYNAWVKHIIERNNGIRGHGAIYPVDLDNDGDLDLAGWMTGSCTLRLYRNDMRGDTANFVKVASYTTPKPSKYPATGYGFLWAGDMDNDGLADVVVPGESIIVVYRNLGNFTFQRCTVGFIRQAHPFCEGVDVDRDGLMDIVEGDSALTVWRNRGNMQFERDSFGIGVFYKLKTGDINNDGYPDILSGGHVHLSDRGVFRMPPTWDANLTGVDGVWIRDYNNDGRPDLLICDQWANPPGIYWYENLDSGFNYRQHTVLRGQRAQRYGDGACAEDIDLNGRADVVGSYSRVGYFRQTGRDTFVEVQVDTLTDSHWVLTRNLDYRPNGGDCDIDILASSNRQFAWWENQVVSRVASRCTLVSSILDAGLPSHWRKLTWDAVRPNGTGLDFYVRTGASAAQLQSRPWQGPIPVVTGRELDTFAISGYTTPGDRYFQYQVRMAGTSAIPVVYSIGVIYDAAIIDVGTRLVLAPVGTVDSGVIVTPTAVIRNWGASDVTTPIRFRVDDGYNSVITRTIVAGAESTFTFAPWTARTCGLHMVRCSTEVNDANNSNNLARESVLVTTRDVGVVRIIAPTDTVDSGTVVAPCAVVHNWGNQTATFQTEFRIDDGYREVILLTLSAGLDSTLTFPDWTALSRGFHTLQCSTLLADADPTNDHRAGTVAVRVRDVGVTAIVAPAGAIRMGTVTPEVVVRNCGTVRGPVSVRLTIFAAGYDETTSLPNGLPFDDTTLRFADWNADTGHYASRCSIGSIADMNPANDTLSSNVVVGLSIPRWVRRNDVPTGGRFKRVKDGGSLAYNEEEDGGVIYALKGNNTTEFYRYDIWTDRWTTRESVPAIGRSSKKKTVKKGATLAQADCRIFAAKGNNTREWWSYTPDRGAGVWTQKTDVPTGAKTLREGAGSATVVIDGTPYVYLLKGSGTLEFYRYNPATDGWETMAPAPAGASRKGFKNGSCLAVTSESDTIFALKGTYNEFFAYDVRSNTWASRETLPRVAPPGSKKKKVKDGAGIACHDDHVYALKGGNTYEFWKYSRPDARWYNAEDILAGPTLKRVRGGGALVYAPCKDNLYALKGNNTWEFYMYWLTDSVMADGHARPGTAAGPALTVSRLFEVFPNPVTDRAVVRFSLAEPARTSVKLYDIAGNLVRTISAGILPAGLHTVTVSREDLAAGIYLVRWECGTQVTSAKLIIN